MTLRESMNSVGFKVLKTEHKFSQKFTNLAYSRFSHREMIDFAPKHSRVEVYDKGEA